MHQDCKYQFISLFLPYLMYYYQSPSFTEKGKHKDALYTLIIWTSIPAVIGILVWVYLYFTKRIDFETTPKTVISLTNA